MSRALNPQSALLSWLEQFPRGISESDLKLHGLFNIGDHIHGLRKNGHRIDKQVERHGVTGQMTDVVFILIHPRVRRSAPKQ